jgi:O-antigen/teichoic acid export membrane protein/Ser/Thr protein kinase RdoA (MazF antagonist)
MSVLGFAFWIFVAHLYSPAHIGAASALISLTLLVSNLSFLGLDAGFVRFLPGSKRQSSDINAAFIAVASISMAAAALCLFLAAGNFSDGLAFFRDTWTGRFLFIFLMATVALNTLADSVFIANRKAHWHTVVYSVFGTVRLVTPLLLVAWGALGIFVSFTAAVVLSLILSIVFMAWSCGYRLLSRPNWKFIRTTRRYTFHNYIAKLFAGLPSQLLPTLIIARLGGDQAAFFAMAWTMANLLHVIPSAITNSLMAESSHDIKQQAQHVQRASRLMAYILIPVVLLSVIVAPYLLQLFGPEYAHGGTGIFQLLAISTFFIAANGIGGSILNLKQRSGGIAIIHGVIAAVSLVLAVPLMHWGLEGAGLAMFGGMVAGTAVMIALVLRDDAPINTEGSQFGRRPSPPVRRAFAEAYGLEERSLGEDLGGGDRSGTWIVKQDGRTHVLKVFMDIKRTRAQILQEVDFGSHLRNAGVPVPGVELSVAGELVTERTINGTKWHGLLMEFVSGLPVEHTYSPDLLADMAQAQAHIHVAGQWYAEHSPKPALAFKDGAFRSLALSFLPKGLSHFDYYGGNVLAQGDRLTAVIDFEGLRYDPLVVCLSFTLINLYAETGDQLTLRRYLTEYQSVRRLKLLERVVLHLILAFKLRRASLLI